MVASWLISLYKDESENIVKPTKLSYATLYPTNFEKQKTSLAQNAFNENTVAVLRLKGFNETATFVNLITKLWNVLNVNSPDKGRRLQHPLQEPFRNCEDARFEYLDYMKIMLGNMNTALIPHAHRVMCLTEETSEVWVTTLTGIIPLIKVRSEKDIPYVL